MVRMRALALVVVGVTAVAIGWLPEASALPAVGPPPSLSLEPSEAVPGQQVTASGRGFPGNDPDGLPRCSVTWDIPEASSDCRLDGSGGLTADVTIPAGTRPGDYTVTATAGRISAEARLRVLFTVPDLDGLTRDRALGELEAAQLSPCDPIDPEGVVVSQDPPPGTGVEKGTCVSVTVRRMVVVPDVVGDTLESARRTLEVAGLAVAGRPNSDQRIISQKPQAGERAPVGSSVSLSFARTPPAPAVLVPDLAGRSVAAARDILGSVGLLLDGAGSDPDLRVAGQSPGPGTRVAPGTPVTVTLESPAVVLVPDLGGMTIDQAAETLRLLGLVLAGAELDAEQRVQNQTPPPRTEVLLGSTVTVALSSAPRRDESGSNLPAVPFIVGVVALALLSVAVTHNLRRKARARAHLRPHVRAHPDTSAEVRSVSRADMRPSALFLDPHPDHTIEPTLTLVDS